MRVRILLGTQELTQKTMDLDTSIEKVNLINSFYKKKLKRLGIKTIRDFLFHFPYRYDDFSKITSISRLEPKDRYCVFGRIVRIENSKTWKKKMTITEALVEDSTGSIIAIWFNQPYLTKILNPGDTVFLAGKTAIRENTNSIFSNLYLSNPIYEKVKSALKTTGKPIKETIHTGRIVPVYPETEGLSSRWFRYILKILLSKFRDKIPEYLPEEIRQENKLLPIREAIQQIHFPDSLSIAQKAQQRFSFEELFLISLFVLREKTKLLKEKGIPIPLNLKIVKKFVSSLPFKLTNAQKKSAWVILNDLKLPHPMNRLLEGDVGSGKTVVAIMAALNVAKAGFQSAIMAPTEILAKQHFQEATRLLKKFEIKIGLLTGKEDKIISISPYRERAGLKNEVIEISRRKLLEKLKKREVDILIGTHTLIQDKVIFGKLALAILDEQHRFGVEQRAKLTAKNRRSKEKTIPHLLSMTATPIPRTLALTIYGDLDLSIINEMPKGRKKIITKIILPKEREKTYKFIEKEVKKGRQIFVICPRIEPSEENQEKPRSLNWTDVKAVKEEYEKLSKEIFPNLRVTMLHGKMSPKEKEEIMINFKNKRSDILVSTSVIEVGIDVPNASVIMIEGAERFGLAQLHQFRGRVGRGKHQSYCLLLTDSTSKRTNQRLKALINCEDGFTLAEKDLSIRGPGDFSGIRQWGIPDLAMSSLKNINMIEKTRVSARKILDSDPGLKNYPQLKKRLKSFGEKIHLE